MDEQVKEVHWDNDEKSSLNLEETAVRVQFEWEQFKRQVAEIEASEERLAVVVGEVARIPWSLSLLKRAKAALDARPKDCLGMSGRDWLSKPWHVSEIEALKKRIEDIEEINRLYTERIVFLADLAVRAAVERLSERQVVREITEPCSKLS